MPNPIFALIRILLICAVVAIPVVVILVLVVKNTKKQNSDQAPEPPAPAAPTEAPAAPKAPVAPPKPAASEAPRTSTIFINGGAPASGNTLGKISIDGRSLTVRYTDVPLEITIPAGRHRVVVEGGVYGDARVDRFMDFGVIDVWTVDLPGGDDADVIRHQMIGYSEYRQALREAGFQVTKKTL